MHKNVVSLCQRWIHYMWCLCQLIRWSHILLALQEHTPKCCMQSLRWLILERITSFQEPSYMCQLHEADYYCKTKKKQNVKCIAIVISEDNKRDYHCQSVTLVGGLCYIEPIYYYWITGYDYIRRDQLLRLVNFYT